MIGLKFLSALASAYLLASASLVSAGILTGVQISVENFDSPGHLSATQPSPSTAFLTPSATFTIATLVNPYSIYVTEDGQLSITLPPFSQLPFYEGAELVFGSFADPSTTIFFNKLTFFGDVTQTASDGGLPNLQAALANQPKVTITNGELFIDFQLNTPVPFGVTYDYSITTTNHHPVIGDPQFSGFVGQSYQIHGVSGDVYNVISTPSFQFNALFTYLESGKCRKGTTCFSHPGNYFGEVGLLFKDKTGVVSRLRAVAGAVDSGMQLMLNDKPVAISAEPVQIGDSSLVFDNAFEMTITTPEFSIRFTNSDMFLNQDVSINAPLLRQIQNFKHAVKSAIPVAELIPTLPHGLLGQTWENKTYPNRWKYIEGQLFNYALADGIFGTTFSYNRFAQ